MSIVSDIKNGLSLSYIIEREAINARGEARLRRMERQEKCNAKRNAKGKTTLGEKFENARQTIGHDTGIDIKHPIKQAVQRAKDKKAEKAAEKAKAAMEYRDNMSAPMVVVDPAPSEEEKKEAERITKIYEDSQKFVKVDTIPVPEEKVDTTEPTDDDYEIVDEG